MKITYRTGVFSHLQIRLALAGLLGVHLLLRQHTQLARVLADGVLLSPLVLLPWGSP